MTDKLLDDIYAFGDDVLNANRRDVFDLVVALVAMAKSSETTKEAIEAEFARIRRLYSKTQYSLTETVSSDPADLVTASYRNEYYKKKC